MAISSPNGWPLSGSSGGSSDASDITSGLLDNEFGGTGADLSATGGTGQVLQQSTTGAAITVAALRATTAGITASTTQTQGQGALTVPTGAVELIAQVATVANANDTITLPAAVANLIILVINDGANTLQIFPASGDNLGAGANTATTLAAGATATFVAYDSTNWKALV